MNIADLRKKSKTDLNKQLQKLREELVKVVRDSQTEPDTDIHAKRNLRRDIAKVMTVINEQKGDQQ